MTQTAPPTVDRFLAVQKRAQMVIERYRESASNYFNILVMGDSGAGKTSLAVTCPTPVFIDSFDPGGTKTRVLQASINANDILCETKWEHDAWKSPFAFREWEGEMQSRRREGMFDFIGTYMLDSASKWSDSMMFAIIQSGKDRNGKSRIGQTPEIQDYLTQQLTAVDWLGWLMDLPCNVLVTAHLGIEKDELTGRIESGPLLYGKLAKKLPIAFDEVYITRPQQSASGLQHRLQTKADGYYIAKSRIGGSALELFEEPNIKKIMQKAGAREPSWKDKEPVFHPAKE